MTGAITRGPCGVLGHVQSSSVSHSMSHSAHNVTSLDLSGKQDIRKANSDERAFLGMKMKKKLENMLLVPQFEVFHHLLYSFFFSMGHSEQVMKAKENG